MHGTKNDGIRIRGGRTLTYTLPGLIHLLHCRSLLHYYYYIVDHILWQLSHQRVMYISITNNMHMMCKKNIIHIYHSLNIREMKAQVVSQIYTFVLESRNKGHVLDNIYRFTCRSRHTMYIAIIIYTSKFIQQLYILKISIITINVSLKTKKHIPYFFFKTRVQTNDSRW